MSKEITTEMLLDMIEKTGWDIGTHDNVVRLDTFAHNMELQQKVKVLEKALELACNKIGDMFSSNYQESWFYSDDNKTMVERDKFEEYFKTKAKEMMKSE
jgi:hypothetical protein